MRPLRNVEIMYRKHALEIFLSPPAPAAQRQQRRLFERMSVSFVFAVKRGAVSKDVQRAEGP
jgi:hypothetical protein